MASVRQGSIHLFRLAGVEVSLHWSWFLIAVYEIESGRSSYGSIVWSVLEYLALFVIVLTHEFGHAMACRQVGGTADHILLWPFGGVAYVNPPQRPGATLWSIAAGPLVNVALAPLFLGAYWLAQSSGWANTNPDALQLLLRFVEIDLGLLAFNILPIYPLDGGQILRSLLWFVMGNGGGDHRHRGLHRHRRLYPRLLARPHLSLLAAQLLGRFAAGPQAHPAGQAAPPPGICLPQLQNRPAYWHLLGVRQLQAAF